MWFSNDLTLVASTEITSGLSDSQNVIRDMNIK